MSRHAKLRTLKSQFFFRIFNIWSDCGPTLKWSFSALTGPFLLIFGEVSRPGGGKRILYSKRVFSYVGFSNPGSPSSRFGQNELRWHSHNFVHRCRSISRLYVFETCSTRSLQKYIVYGVNDDSGKNYGGELLIEFDENQISEKWDLRNANLYQLLPVITFSRGLTAPTKLYFLKSTRWVLSENI